LVTERHAAGMGPRAGRMTELKDHSEKVVTSCMPVPGADAACIDAKLSRIGADTGEWKLGKNLDPQGAGANTCQSMTSDIIEACGGPTNFDPWSSLGSSLDPGGVAWGFPF